MPRKVAAGWICHACGNLLGNNERTDPLEHRLDSVIDVIHGNNVNPHAERVNRLDLDGEDEAPSGFGAGVHSEPEWRFEGMDGQNGDDLVKDVEGGCVVVGVVEPQDGGDCEGVASISIAKGFNRCEANPPFGWGGWDVFEDYSGIEVGSVANDVGMPELDKAGFGDGGGELAREIEKGLAGGIHN